MTGSNSSVREQFLFAGERQVREAGGLISGLESITVNSLAQSLDPPRARSSFHAIWDTRDAFIDELLGRLLSYGVAAFETVVGQVAPRIEANVGPWDDLVKEAANANFVQVRASDDLATFREALCLVSHPVYGQTVQTALAEQLEQIVNTFSSLYRFVLPIYRRKVRQGVTVEDIVVIMASLVEGLAFTWKVNDAHTRDDLEWEGSGGWTLYAVAVKAILESLTEPMADAESP